MREFYALSVYRKFMNFPLEVCSPYRIKNKDFPATLKGNNQNQKQHLSELKIFC